MQKEPPAFSRHHADNPHLPWPFDAHNRDGQHRFVHAVRALAEASETAATDSQDMDAIEPKAWAAGRNAKEKARKRAREVEEDQVEDEEDWFARSTSGGGGGRGGSKRGEKRPEQSNSSRRNGADKTRKKHGSSKAQDEVAAWFDTGRAGASASNSGSGKKGQSSKSRSQPQSSRERDRDRETQDEREEREYLEYQTRNGGRYDEAEDHSVRSRSHGGRRGDDHGNGRERDRDRDHDRDRDTHASRNRTPDHRGGRDRRESRTQPRSHFTASFGFDSEADGPSTNGPRVPSTTTTATEKTAGSVPNLSISIRGASGASKGGGGKQGLLAKRLGPTQASEANDQGASGGSRENGEGGKFRPKWRGGYGR
ncbi:hypothetical protein DL93DRAFT_136974 [Clavulina sp. PMI_390]|nr:hypothetical protein DL93DRAFT_136974 [Clavulina sp. PMI_390]